MPLFNSFTSISPKTLGGFGSIPGLTVSYPATSATQILQSGVTESGYYYIKPQNTTYYVYCDMQNQGGAWMLMMRVVANSTIHVTSTAAALTTVNGNSTVSPTLSTATRWSTATINEFLSASGTHVTWIEPQRTNIATSLNSNKQWWQRPGTTGIWPNSVECNNYSSYINTTDKAWLWSGYPTANDAINNTNKSTGNYSGANHFAPTVYPVGQSFFGGNTGNGIRFNSPWNATSPYTDNNAGYLWLKTV